MKMRYAPIPISVKYCLKQSRQIDRIGAGSYTPPMLMEKKVMKFRLFGIQIYISFFFCAVFTVMLACDRTGMILPTFFAILMHEIGHLFAMWALDCEPRQIRLVPASVQIVSGFSKRYKNDIIVAVCGPAVNIVLFLTLYFNYLVFKNELTLYYALLNLIVGAFNLLPVSGLDGGTVLFSIIAKRKDISHAALTIKLITLITAVLVISAAIVLTIRGNLNISVYIVGIYLFVMSSQSI